MRAAALLALAAAMALGAQAFAWPWKKGQAKLVELADVMKSPQEFLGREVSFKCRFAMQGKLFKSFNTRFNENEHANFAVWCMDAKLWDKTDRRNVLPTLYVDKSLAGAAEMLRSTAKYDVVEITGEVVSVYAGLPWLMVTDLRKVEAPEEKLGETTVAHVRQGLDLLAEGKADIAARHLEMALEAGVPQSQRAGVVEKLGEAYRAAGDNDKAAKLLGEAVTLKGDNAESLLSLAEVNLGKGLYQEAADNCKKAQALAPESSRAYALAGEAYGHLGQTSEALAMCDLAANVPGISAEDKAMVEVRRARVLVGAKRYADAIRAYAYTISDVSPLAGKPWLRREIAGLYEDRFDATGKADLLEEAAREYRNANSLSKTPEVEGLYLLARVEYKKGKAGSAEAMAGAKQILQDAAKLDDHYLPARVLEARILLSEGNTEEAKKVLLALTEDGGKTPETLGALAEVYEKAGDDQGACETYARIVELDPKNREALEKHVALCEKLGNPTGARASLSKLADLFPADAGYAMRLGQMLFKSGEFNEAAAAFARAGGAPGKQGADATVMMARSLALAGDERQAESVYRALIARGDGNTEAMGRLSMLLANQGRKTAEALNLAERAYDKNQGDPIYADMLGWAKLAAGEAKGAAEMLDGIPAEKRDRLVWYHLGEAKFAVGDFTAAVEACNKAAGEVGADEIGAVARDIAVKAKALLEKAQAAGAEESKHAALEVERQAALAAAKDAASEEDAAVPAAPAVAAETTAPAASDEEPGIPELSSITESPVEVKSEPKQEQPAASVESMIIPGGEAKGEAPRAEILETVEVPGINDGIGAPCDTRDLSALSGPADKKSNANIVSNLPAAAKRAAEPELDYESHAGQAKPAAPAAPQPETPAAQPGESAAVAEPAAAEDLPRNDIEGLPDWAR